MVEGPAALENVDKLQFRSVTRHWLSVRVTSEPLVRLDVPATNARFVVTVFRVSFTSQHVIGSTGPGEFSLNAAAPQQGAAALAPWPGLEAVGDHAHEGLVAGRPGLIVAPRRTVVIRHDRLAHRGLLVAARSGTQLVLDLVRGLERPGGAFAVALERHVGETGLQFDDQSELGSRN